MSVFRRQRFLDECRVPSFRRVLVRVVRTCSEVCFLMISLSVVSCDCWCRRQEEYIPSCSNNDIRDCPETECDNWRSSLFLSSLIGLLAIL